jgi:hypothetical protein
MEITLFEQDTASRGSGRSNTELLNAATEVAVPGTTIAATAPERALAGYQVTGLYGSHFFANFFYDAGPLVSEAERYRVGGRVGAFVESQIGCTNANRMYPDANLSATRSRQFQRHLVYRSGRGEQKLIIVHLSASASGCV